MVNKGGRPSGASINAACRRQKNHTTGLRPSEMHPFCLRHLSAGKRLTRFSVAYGSLRIVFACHPGGGGLLSASLSANLSRSLLSAAKGAVKKWLIFYQIARQSGGRRLIFNELTQKGSPLQCHFDRSRSAANRKASYWAG